LRECVEVAARCGDGDGDHQHTSHSSSWFVRCGISK
jgi:hypothetical protein